MSHASESEWLLHNVENTTNKGREKEKKRAHIRACALEYMLYIYYTITSWIFCWICWRAPGGNLQITTHTHTHIYTHAHTHTNSQKTLGVSGHEICDIAYLTLCTYE